MNESDFKTLVLPSVPESITLVEPFLKSFPPIALLSYDRFHNLLVAVTEAVNNAIIHAHAHEASKLVTMRAFITSGSIRVQVEDTGAGFDVNTVPDPRLPENVLREGGRGIFLIKNLSDLSEFQCTDTGMLVTMVFSLD